VVIVCGVWSAPALGHLRFAWMDINEIRDASVVTDVRQHRVHLSRDVTRRRPDCRLVVNGCDDDGNFLGGNVRYPTIFISDKDGFKIADQYSATYPFRKTSRQDDMPHFIDL